MRIIKHIIVLQVYNTCVISVGNKALQKRHYAYYAIVINQSQVVMYHVTVTVFTLCNYKIDTLSTHYDIIYITMCRP